MIRKNSIIVVLLVFSVLFQSFQKRKKSDCNRDRNVELSIPTGYPDPVYNFANNRLSIESFELGRKLFYDPILSRDSGISCGSCHHQSAAFSDPGIEISMGVNGLKGKRNTSALQNLIWKTDFMADGGVNHIEVQPLSPISNPQEMGEDIAHVIIKLNLSREYKRLFYAAFNDSNISSQNMLRSLSQFTGSMISLNSKYDLFLAGKVSFTAFELNGLKLFRRNCTQCHAEPFFTDGSFRNNGLVINNLTDDKGKGVITGNLIDNYKFKVPSLRNVAVTNPYMHDGRFKDLNQVLDHYGKGHNFENDHADQILKQIGNLTEMEKLSLISFLNTLTDSSFLTNPFFVDPNKF